MKLNKKKVDKIYKLWANGEKIEAAKRVAAINRREMVELLVNPHRYETGMTIRADKDRWYNFTVFVECALADILVNMMGK